MNNLSNIQFNDSELSLLEKGFKFNFASQLKPRDVKVFVGECKLLLDQCKLSAARKNVLSGKLVKLIKSQSQAVKASKCHLQEYADCNSINKKLVDHDALVLKADKGNSLVVLSKQDYVCKTLEFFQLNNIFQIDRDPTVEFNNKIKHMLGKCCFLFPAKEKKCYVVMNPTALVLRSQPNIHKESVPIRPIVNGIDNPGYLLGQKLNKILTQNYVFPNGFMLKNSSQLISDIKDIGIPDGAILLSLNVVNLYTNVPVDEAVELVRLNFLKYRKLSVPEIVEFIEMLSLILSYNYFTFDGKVYKQEKGLATGCCLAGTLANIFLGHLENKFFALHLEFSTKVIYYRRYEGDTIILFNGSLDEARELQSVFNSMHPNVEFTMECQTNNSICFLYLCVINDNGKHSFDIFRKKTTTDVVIHNSSAHPIKYKYVFFNSMVDRILRLPLSDSNIGKELKILTHIAVSNGYEASLVDTIYKKKVKIKNQKEQQSTALQPLRDKKKDTFVSFPYIDKIADKVKQLFRAYNVNIAFQNSNEMGRVLHHKVSNKSVYDQAGVYQISCQQFSSFYIGQTGRKLATRFREYKNPSNASALGKHILECKHDISGMSDSMKLLHRVDKGLLMNIMEEIEMI